MTKDGAIDTQLPGWLEVERYIASETPCELVVLQQPQLFFVYFPGPHRFGLRLEPEKGPEVTPKLDLKHVDFKAIVLGGRRYYELVAHDPALFRALHALGLRVAEEIARGQPASSALFRCLREFGRLAEQESLSQERVIGLWGELWFFERLLQAGHVPDSWRGHAADTHDFRCGDTEYEIKTTTSSVREHWIHGVNQLEPSPGLQLDLVSLRIAVSASERARSLNALCDACRTHFRSDVDQDRFNFALTTLGYNDRHESSSTAYVLAAPAMRITIGAHFPIFSHGSFRTILGSAHLARLRGFKALVSFEGLGVPLPEE